MVNRNKKRNRSTLDTTPKLEPIPEIDLVGERSEALSPRLDPMEVDEETVNESTVIVEPIVENTINESTVIVEPVLNESTVIVEPPKLSLFSRIKKFFYLA